MNLLEGKDLKETKNEITTILKATYVMLLNERKAKSLAKNILKELTNYDPQSKYSPLEKVQNIIQVKLEGRMAAEDVATKIFDSLQLKYNKNELQ